MAAPTVVDCRYPYGDLSRDHDRAAGCFAWALLGLPGLLAPVRGA